jgi:hypothetical protein
MEAFHTGYAQFKSIKRDSKQLTSDYDDWPSLHAHLCPPPAGPFGAGLHRLGCRFPQLSQRLLDGSTPAHTFILTQHIDSRLYETKCLI